MQVQDPQTTVAVTPQVPDPQTTVAVTPVDWWDAFVVQLMSVMTLLTRGFLKFLGFLLIIIIGWVISSWLGRIVAALLRRVKFNELAERTGLSRAVARMGGKHDPSGLVGEVIKWIVRVVVLVIAFAALGLPALSSALNAFILWLPNLVIALAILFIGGLAANALADVVRGITADSGFRNPNTLANITRAAIWVFAVVIAVNQVGIGDQLVNTLLIAVVSAIALATGLAFGLGGRDLAAKTLDRWNQNAQESRGKIESAKEPRAKYPPI